LEKTIKKNTTLETINVKKKTTLEKVAWMTTTSKKAMLEKATIQRRKFKRWKQ